MKKEEKTELKKDVKKDVPKIKTVKCTDKTLDRIRKKEKI
jgi:hypothetical protein